MTALSVIVASSGRPTLGTTLASIQPQLREGDECLVSVNRDCPWGHRARNQLMRCARGDALMFMDDDDVYLDGALETVRAAFAVEPRRLHIFCMRYASNGVVLGPGRFFACGHLSTQMVVVPRARIVRDHGDCLYAMFSDRYEGDWDFAKAAQSVLGDPVWHPEVISLIRPHEAAS